MTMTFVGFKVDDKGQCHDFKSDEFIEDCWVPVNVCECLLTQGVNLQKEDCNTWTKYVNAYSYIMTIFNIYMTFFNANKLLNSYVHNIASVIACAVYMYVDCIR